MTEEEFNGRASATSLHPLSGCALQSGLLLPWDVL